MFRNWASILLCSIMIIALLGCSNVAKTPDDRENAVNASSKSLTLPATFPTDFPFPENITITEIKDSSEEDKYSFGIRFTFDPNIDMKGTFEMYDNYAKGLGYNTIIGGEEFFAKDIFQYGATSKLSAADMFIVTLNPVGKTFGDIQLKYRKKAD